MRRSRALFLTIVLAAAGCGDRLDSTGPSLDTAAPFPELATASTAASEGATQPVSLAGLLAGEIRSESWRLFSEPGETVTVLAHTSADNRTDALVWAEAASALGEEQPSAEQVRFLLTVDPALARPSLAWEESTFRRAPGQPPRIREAVHIATTRTGGRGLGYASSAGSFTGWKWIGRNDHGIFFRLARTRGSWGEQPFLDRGLQTPVDHLIQRFPSLAGLRAGLPAAAAPSRSAQLSAEMILGSAGAPEGAVHLALLCARNPVCAPARDLADILASLRPLGAGIPGRSSPLPALPLSELAYEPGIAVAPRASILDPVTEKPAR